MPSNPVRTFATLVLAACLGLGLATPVGADPGTADGAAHEDTLELRDQFFGTGAAPGTVAGARSARGRTVLPRPQWDAALTRGQACTDLVCVHYVTGSSDAPPLASSTGGTPDWVDLTLRTAQESLLRMVQLGWPLPPSDAGAGGTAQFDVYLQDVGRRGLYGYCAPEHLVPGERNVASSYCVLDNDFAEFALPPTPSMRVTVAHELFHAVQFGSTPARTAGSSRRPPPGWRSRSPTTSTTTGSTSRHGAARRPRHPARHLRLRAGLLRQLDLLPAAHPALRQPGGAPGLGPRGRARGAPQRLLGAGDASRYVESRGVSWPRFYAGFIAANRTARGRRTPRGRPTGRPTAEPRPGSAGPTAHGRAR